MSRSGGKRSSGRGGSARGGERSRNQGNPSRRRPQEGGQRRQARDSQQREQRKDPARQQQTGDHRIRQPQGSQQGRHARRSQGSSSQRPSHDSICGHHAVLEALDASVPIMRILIADDADPAGTPDRILELATRDGIELRRVSRARLDRESAGVAHQGVIAIAKPFEHTPLGTVMAACEGQEAALVVLLDHITDVGNFGAIVRSAEVIGAAGVVIPDRRSVSVVPSVYKTSAGAVARIPISRVSNISAACEKLKDNGFWIAGASEKGESDCWSSQLSGRVGLVMGSESDGISRLVRSKCDFLVRLPQRGDIGSLNVSCAMAALGYEWLRQSVSDGMIQMDGSR